MSAPVDHGLPVTAQTAVTAPLGVGSISWDTIEGYVVQAGLRYQMELLNDLLLEHGTGVLITLDEIHQNQVQEFRESSLARCSTRSARTANSRLSALAWPQH